MTCFTALPRVREDIESRSLPHSSPEGIHAGGSPGAYAPQSSPGSEGFPSVPKETYATLKINRSAAPRADQVVRTARAVWLKDR